MRNAAGVLQRVLFNPSRQLPFTTPVLGTAVAAVATTARSYASAAALVLNQFGVPENVLKLAHVDVPSPDSLKENEVLINIMAVRHFFPCCLFSPYLFGVPEASPSFNPLSYPVGVILFLFLFFTSFHYYTN